MLVSKAVMDNITQINNEYEKMTKIEKPRHPPLPVNERISNIYQGKESIMELIVSKFIFIIPIRQKNKNKY